MDECLISVIVATFRRDKELARALESIRTQTYRNLEVIVVDDNGDPSWNETVREIVGNAGVSARLIRNEKNLGSAKARNIGIYASGGEYVTFLDDDDVYLPEKVERQARAMTESGADYSITDLDLYYENDRLAEHRRRSYIKDQSRLLEYHFMYHMTGTDTLMFRRPFLMEIGAFPEINLGDEFYLMHEAIRLKGRFTYLPRCDVKAYVHKQEGLSSGTEKVRGENKLYEYKKRYFSAMSGKAVRAIKMRHHAVLYFTGVRAKQYGFAVAHGILAVLISPVEAFKLIYRRLT